MKESFSIQDLALMTGLSTRTLRNYLSAGFLSGDKSGGAWVFTASQVEDFLQNPAVKPAVRAKKNAIVYDFLGAKPDGEEKLCVVLNLSAQAAPAATAFFCERISQIKPESELHFASDPLGKGARLILSGAAKDVHGLLCAYYGQR